MSNALWSSDAAKDECPSSKDKMCPHDSSIILTCERHFCGYEVYSKESCLSYLSSPPNLLITINNVVAKRNSFAGVRFLQTVASLILSRLCLRWSERKMSLDALFLLNMQENFWENLRQFLDFFWFSGRLRATTQLFLRLSSPAKELRGCAQLATAQLFFRLHALTVSDWFEVVLKEISQSQPHSINSKFALVSRSGSFFLLLTFDNVCLANP